MNKIKARKIFELSSAVYLLLFVMTMESCRKLIEIDPPINEIVGTDIYGTNATAASVLTGIYTDMSSTIFSGAGSITLFTGLSADELVTTTTPESILSILYRNALTNNGDQLFWTPLFTFVFESNAAIEGLTRSTGITPELKKQLIAEAKFVRAFMYFYLVNLYGDVPLLLTTDVRNNATAKREDKAIVYSQIIADLKEAQLDINDWYLAPNALSPSLERLKPNKAAVTALLARVYLYTEQWELAEAEASKLIDNDGRYTLEPLDVTFGKASKEAIWQLQPIVKGQNTKDAEVFILYAGPGFDVAGPNGSNRPVYISKFLFNAFESGDRRKELWIDSVKVDNVVYPFSTKYKAWQSNVDRTEYLIVFRLAEQYLIRAEARLNLNKINGPNSAISDLNSIRNRAGLNSINPTTKREIFLALMQERRVELFVEWANRWFDLKRSKIIDEVMTNVSLFKGGSWNSDKSLYPIPIYDIMHNPSLKGNQNPGYPES